MKSPLSPALLAWLALPAAAFAAARHVVEIELVNNRLVIAPTETRSAIASFRDGTYHLFLTAAGVPFETLVAGVDEAWLLGGVRRGSGPAANSVRQRIFPVRASNAKRAHACSPAMAVT